MNTYLVKLGGLYWTGTDLSDSQKSAHRFSSKAGARAKAASLNHFGRESTFRVVRLHEKRTPSRGADFGVALSNSTPRVA